MCVINGVVVPMSYLNVDSRLCTESLYWLITVLFCSSLRWDSSETFHFRDFIIRFDRKVNLPFSVTMNSLDMKDLFFIPNFPASAWLLLTIVDKTAPGKFVRLHFASTCKVFVMSEWLQVTRLVVSFFFKTKNEQGEIHIWWWHRFDSFKSLNHERLL